MNINKILAGLSVLLIAIVIICILISPQFLWFFPSEKTQNITIQEKWTKYNNNDMYYLFSDMNGNIYKITDDWWYLKFNSSDQYGMIQPGKTYQMKTCGWRTQWLSEYPNVISISPS